MLTSLVTGITGETASLAAGLRELAAGLAGRTSAEFLL